MSDREPREFWVCETWDPVLCERVTLDEDPGSLPSGSTTVVHVREVIDNQMTELEEELLSKAEGWRNMCDELAGAIDSFASINHIDWNKVAHYQILKSALAKYEAAKKDEK